MRGIFLSTQTAAGGGLPFNPPRSKILLDETAQRRIGPWLRVDVRIRESGGVVNISKSKKPCFDPRGAVVTEICGRSADEIAPARMQDTRGVTRPWQERTGEKNAGGEISEGHTKQIPLAFLFPPFLPQFKWTSSIPKPRVISLYGMRGASKGAYRIQQGVCGKRCMTTVFAVTPGCARLPRLLNRCAAGIRRACLHHTLAKSRLYRGSPPVTFQYPRFLGNGYSFNQNWRICYSSYLRSSLHRSVSSDVPHHLNRCGSGSRPIIPHATSCHVGRAAYGRITKRALNRFRPRCTDARLMRARSVTLYHNVVLLTCADGVKKSCPVSYFPLSINSHQGNIFLSAVLLRLCSLCLRTSAGSPTSCAKVHRELNPGSSNQSIHRIRGI